ncbi:hypothetical protein [Mycobacterium sp. 94-17]|uniref:hypothetical protein n=1 Tax=Mycobacterium sp. 94-17 TaxID=2986147 RepID=UPI002D1F13FC|nr:hypothetical protein [Mycobacterium sp. 94-17]MEB4211449.1 hypothetical protein [Mycobacterium sp. 94-17]
MKTIAVKLLVAPVFAGAVTSLLAAAPAHADPPCARFNTCQYMPNPYNDGPLMPTWNVPGTYGGWTNLPVMCNPATYRCDQYIPTP